jgi:hypothetical protein
LSLVGQSLRRLEAAAMKSWALITEKPRPERIA